MARAASAVARPAASAAVAGEVLGPVVHQPPPALEQVRPRVGRLDLVLNDVGERRLDHLPRMVGLLGRPVPERRAEAMRQRRRPRGTGASSGTSTRLSTSRSASGTRGRRRRRASEPRRGLPAPGRTAGPGARASPSSVQPGIVHTAPAVSISVPRREPDLAGPRGRQHQKLERQPDGRLRPSPRPAPSRWAAATSLCGSACRCVTMSFCGPSTGTTRSHGLVGAHVERPPRSHRNLFRHNRLPLFGARLPHRVPHNTNRIASDHRRRLRTDQAAQSVETCVDVLQARDTVP